MSVYSKLRGIIGSIFQLGLGGPNLKANAGVIEARNAADGAFAVVRGATPSAGNDLTTKDYVDGFNGGELHLIRFAIDNTAAQASTNQIPINARIVESTVEVTTPYSAGATITVGNSATANLFQDTTDNNAEAANAYSVPQDTLNGVASTVRVAVTGSPAAGVGVVSVKYGVPLA